MSTTTDEVIQIVRSMKNHTGPIGPDTFFFKDLGMSSIDAVVLSEKLEAHFKKRFPFFAFVAKLRLKQVKDIQISELVTFIEDNI